MSVIPMPSTVTSCDVSTCSFNKNNACHALAITVGDGQVPHCDTFCQLPTRALGTSADAGVGACKVADCRFNQSLRCVASSVQVGRRGGEVLCLTYTPVGA
jgi:hypothetical protein